MIKGKKVYICSPLSAKTKEERLFNMGLAKAYLDTISRYFTAARLPLMPICL